MARQCFYIPEDQFVPGRGYIPSLVTEDEPGHSPMSGRGEFSEPWYWGMDIDTARRIAAEANARDFGLTPEQVDAIISSSIAASIRVDSARDRLNARLAYGV